MKKLLFLSLAWLCFAFVCETHAQVTVYDGGDIGIGTTSAPASKLEVNGTVTCADGDSTEWSAAHGWGDHAAQGYLTSEVDGDTSNELQSLFATINGNTGSTTANLVADTLSIVGTGYVSTSISGDTVSIASSGDNLGNHIALQNLDLSAFRLVGNSGAGGIYIYASGIVDLDSQSRARAFLTHQQSIPFSMWTPIEFDDDFTLSGGYDQQNEFTLYIPMVTPAFFIATEAGYYQVNARTEFIFKDVDVIQGGYVSIAIFVNGIMYAQGNNLQMISSYNEWLENNNAPNVSDVVWLQPGDVLEILVWQSVGAPAGILVPNTEKTYVSIHKSS